MNPLRSKVKCAKCGKNYKRKIEKGRGNPKLICGGYENGNGCKERLIIHEEFIRGLINRRYRKELSDVELVEILGYILIEDKLIMEIHFTDGSIPILLKGNFIQF